MNLIPIATTERRQVQQFLDLPFRIYRDCPQWVPPLEADARHALDRRRHPFYQHSDAAFFLVTQDDGRPIGRIAVLDHHNYNAFNHERTAFFYLFECEDNPEAAQTIIRRRVRLGQVTRVEQDHRPQRFYGARRDGAAGQRL